ncbi:MAG: cytochrome c [Paracoccaceae bacterium]|jgi:mono/diheme cytochrome c family protein|nr:cytochrome c [Paracoccaceae bacterium]
MTPSTGRRAAITLLAWCLAAPLAGPAAAQSVELGRTEYLSACAGCHGRDARGDGPLADLMKITTPDLTALTQSNDGAFPFDTLLQVIDGRMDLGAHGGDMPIWGTRYTAQALREGASIEDAVLMTQGRLLALVSYLNTIQQ